jgi:hypothetical protein
MLLAYSFHSLSSTEVREELKGQDLSFTEIAKIVGERWQVLASKTRDTFERQAQTAKEKYYAELAEYKKTSQYSLYQEYLAEFKAKHAAPRTGTISSDRFFNSLLIPYRRKTYQA